MSTMNVKKGDLVVVTAGSDAGRKGKVLSASPDTGKVIVEGVNIQKRHKKPKNAKAAGGITSNPGPVNVSNVMPVCSKCGKGVRVRHTNDAATGKSVRVCVKCGKPLDDASAVHEKTAREKKEKVEAETKETAEKPVKKASGKSEKKVNKTENGQA